MSNEETQRDEIQVLDSMYGGDQFLTIIDDKKFKIKIEDLEGEPSKSYNIVLVLMNYFISNYIKNQYFGLDLRLKI
jgi:hypothetical protein